MRVCTSSSLLSERARLDGLCLDSNLFLLAAPSPPSITPGIAVVLGNSLCGTIAARFKNIFRERSNHVHSPSNRKPEEELVGSELQRQSQAKPKGPVPSPLIIQWRQDWLEVPLVRCPASRIAYELQLEQQADCLPRGHPSSTSCSKTNTAGFDDFTHKLPLSIKCACRR